jgi:hypothetical protein
MPRIVPNGRRLLALAEQIQPSVLSIGMPASVAAAIAPTVSLCRRTQVEAVEIKEVEGVVSQPVASPPRKV